MASAPDIDVIDLAPARSANLQYAVECLMAELKQNAQQKPEAAAVPDSYQRNGDRQ